MTIIQLYQEFHDINKTKPTGNVVVIYWDSSNGKEREQAFSYWQLQPTNPTMQGKGQ